MAAVHDCDFQLVAHPSYSLDLALSDSHVSQHEETHGWDPLSFRLFGSTGGKLLH